MVRRFAGAGGAVSIMSHSDYLSFRKTIRKTIPETRIISDPLRTLAYGTDASFYRLVPKVVVRAESESEVIKVLQTAHAMGLPVTFRAAGTSLSGQAITDSILLVAGTKWKKYEILDGGAKIRLQPGIIGARANQYLSTFGRKIGPDPASINSAMIGGIAANNASGMCCGTAQNSYQTVDSLRIIFADGTLLDTSEAADRQAFARHHGEILSRVSRLAADVCADAALSARIRQKFKIKNTTGYSLNALVDYQDPFDIIVHLMIGSEGTLGFISDIVYNTVVEHPYKATSLIIFANTQDACRSVERLKATPVNAVELMDRAALRSVEAKKGMPGYLKSLPPEATALLVETRAGSKDELQRHVSAILQSLDCMPLPSAGQKTASGKPSSFPPMQCGATLLPVQFTDNVDEYTMLWNIRKGLFPAVGAVRQVGTTVIIEDVAFPMKHLADATASLQQTFKKYHYHEAIIFGHALEGNLHFVFTQDFNRREEVERYRRFMDDVCHMVVDTYDGSLKAEHGTGRNMAPFVEMEWGAQAYALMKAIKDIFDPQHLLNPGVILSDNPQLHIQNLKPLPPAHSIIDKCIECGFCEDHCPSKDLSLTPRQRIVIQREIARLKATCDNPERLEALEKGYRYLGEQTCAADGLCAVSCPVEIDTGAHTKVLRSQGVALPRFQTLADWAATHFDLVAALLRTGLKLAHLIHHTLGTRAMQRLTGLARTISCNRLPAWTPFMPQGINAPRMSSADSRFPRQAVYFPSCINMVMGPAMGDPDQRPLHQVVVKVLNKAGFGVVYPSRRKTFCCGTPFESKGFLRQADLKSRELEDALLTVSQGGQLPILCDTGPCVYRLRQTMDSRLKIYEPVEFILNFLLDHLHITPAAETIAMHITCSSRKLGLEKAFHQVAEILANEAVFPDEVACCGWAGDRGFNFPELTASALSGLRSAVQQRCTSGYSNSRTCEIGLTQHSDIFYKSIFYLLDRCSRPLGNRTLP
jgi:D-lactate dehydrogenase